MVSSGLWEEMKEVVIWLVGTLALGFLTMLSWIGNREMRKIDSMQKDWIGREEVERRLYERNREHDDKLEKIHNRVDAIYTMLANRRDQ